MSSTITSSQAHARIALANILTCLHRRGEARHNHICELVEKPSFHWLADQAGFDPHLTRLAFRQELERVKSNGFGLKGRGRVGGGRK